MTHEKAKEAQRKIDRAVELSHKRHQENPNNAKVIELRILKSVQPCTLSPLFYNGPGADPTIFVFRDRTVGVFETWMKGMLESHACRLLPLRFMSHVKVTKKLERKLS